MSDSEKKLRKQVRQLRERVQELEILVSALTLRQRNSDYGLVKK